MNHIRNFDFLEKILKSVELKNLKTFKLNLE